VELSSAADLHPLRRRPCRCGLQSHRLRSRLPITRAACEDGDSRVASFSFLVKRTWPLGRSVGAARAGRAAALRWPDPELPQPDPVAATVDLPSSTATMRCGCRGDHLSLGLHVRPPWPSSAPLGPRGPVVIAAFPLSRHRCLSVVGRHPHRRCLRHQPRGLPHSQIRVSGRCWGNLYLGLAPACFVVSVLGDGVVGRYSLCVGYLWNLAPLVVFFISGMGGGVSYSPWHYKLSVLHVGFLCSGIHLTSPSAVASGVVVLWSLCRCVVGRRPVVPLISLILNCSLLLHRLSLNLALEVVVRVGFGGLSESSSYSYQCRQRLWAFP
jgi:hypothetical protein